MKIGANSAPKPNLGPHPASRKCRRWNLAQLPTRPDGRYFSYRQSDFPFGQYPETTRHRKAILSGCPHRRESQPLRHLCRAGLQRLRDRAAPARVEGSGGSHGGDDKRDMAGVVEYRSGERVDPRQRIAQGARKTIAAYFSKHVRSLLQVATGIITDAKTIEFGFKRGVHRLRRQK